MQQEVPWYFPVQLNQAQKASVRNRLFEHFLTAKGYLSGRRLFIELKALYRAKGYDKLKALIWPD